MVNVAEERPMYVCIEVRIQVGIWVGNDFGPDAVPVRPADVKDHAHLCRIYPEDNPLLTCVNMSEMAAKCTEAIGARIIDRL